MKPRRITKILYSSHFERALKTLHRDALIFVDEREKIFRSNCFDTRLRTHKLKGKFKKYWSFSITYSLRILFEFVDTDAVSFIDIGDHALYQ